MLTVQVDGRYLVLVVTHHPAEIGWLQSVFGLNLLVVYNSCQSIMSFILEEFLPYPFLQRR